MALTVPHEGEQQMLSLVLGKTASESLRLRLYSAGVVAETNTTASFTECSGSNYAYITLPAAGSWTVDGSGASSSGRAYCAQQTFTLNGALTAKGYYIVGATSGKVYWAEAFPSDYVIPAGGGTINITPAIELN